MYKPHKSRNSLIKTASTTPGQHLATRRDANFAVDVFNMIAYGVVAEVELFWNIMSRDALKDQRSDFEFATGQSRLIKFAVDFLGFVYYSG